MSALTTDIINTIVKSNLVKNADELVWSSQTHEQLEAVLESTFSPLIMTVQTLIKRQKELQDSCNLLKDENAKLQMNFARLSNYVKERSSH